MKQANLRTMHRFSLTLILIGIACRQGPPHYGVAPESDGKYPAGEAAAVYSAVLEKLYISSGESPPMVVLWDSARYRASECWQKRCPRIPPHRSAISNQTIDEFERATRLTAPLRAEFGFRLPVELLSEKYRDDLEAIGQPISDSLRKVNSYSESSPFWLGFRKRYPKAWGYTVLTRVGFDRDRQQALVQVMHRCGSACDHTEDMFLEKTIGRWVVAERMLLGPRGSDWVDVVRRINSPYGDGRDSLVLGPLRYLGPDAQFLARTRKWIDSVRALVRDSIARNPLPRSTTGTIRSRITGMPIAFAEVIAHVPPYDTKIRVVADSSGRYFFPDLPIGKGVLEVLCPGAQGAVGKTLDVSEPYVHRAPAADMNFTVRSIAPCWERGTIHRLSSGWLESKEAMTASTPDADEGDVYRTVIETLRRGNTRTRVEAIFSHTIPRCDYDEDCGVAELARLEREGSVDSFMIRNFKAKTASRSALHPAFARSAGLPVVTAQEIAYYAEEAEPFGGHHVRAATDSALFWSVFRKMNGRGRGIVSLSGVGFDQEGTRALVEARLDTAMPAWRSPTMLLLRKVAGRWRVMIDDVGKGATSGEWIEGRCLPVVSPPDPTKSAVDRLSGQFLVTMLENTGQEAPRPVLIRLWHAFPKRAPLFTPKLPVEHANSKPPLVFEIIDASTGKANEERSLDFMIRGGGTNVERNSALMRLDGYTYSLNIRRATSSGFFGSWSAGVYGPGAFGHFCARRVRQP
jgi:hypothetical protein